MSPPADIVERIVARGGDADDVLRTVVDRLAEEDGVVWAGIAFVEDDTLRLGPASGRMDESRRARIPISFQDAGVGELWVDGATQRDELERIAILLAPLVLIGWDTGGNPWDP